MVCQNEINDIYSNSFIEVIGLLYVFEKKRSNWENNVIYHNEDNTIDYQMYR